MLFPLWLLPGHPLDEKDQMVDMLPTLKERLQKRTDPNILFSIINDLAKVDCYMQDFVAYSNPKKKCADTVWFNTHEYEMISCKSCSALSCSCIWNVSVFVLKEWPQCLPQHYEWPCQGHLLQARYVSLTVIIWKWKYICVISHLVPISVKWFCAECGQYIFQHLKWHCFCTM